MLTLTELRLLTAGGLLATAVGTWALVAAVFAVSRWIRRARRRAVAGATPGIVTHPPPDDREALTLPRDSGRLLRNRQALWRLRC